MKQEVRVERFLKDNSLPVCELCVAMQVSVCAHVQCM